MTPLGKKFSSDQIIGKLGEAELDLRQGMTSTPEV